MERNQDIITFTTEDGDEVKFHVIEETRINGRDYLLVLDVSAEGETEAIYEIVEDEKELTAVAGLFSELLDDTDLVF